MATPTSPSTSSPTGHRFGRPRLLAGAPPARTAYDTDPFQPLPPPVGTYPFHLDLAAVVGAGRVAAIEQAGELCFHLMGDSGGIANPLPQMNVATALEVDVAEQPDGFIPAFLYLLGDCVYFNGQESDYYAQFYEPYTHYNLPILAIPGNHDGDPIDTTQSTLDGFVQNFCSPTPQGNPQAGDTGRTTMTQPYVYWTLEAPFATVVGIYTNVPEYGQLDDAQVAWLGQELSSAPATKALLVTMHHPPVSADSYHGSSAYLFGLLDQAMQQSGRLPDLICAGHVHDYQRFTRQASPVGGTGTLTYLVAGAGGYHNLHTIAANVKKLPLPAPYPDRAGIMIQAFNDTHYGYCRLRISAGTIRVEFVQVSPVPGVATSALAPSVFDTVTLAVRH